MVVNRYEKTLNNTVANRNNLIGDYNVVNEDFCRANDAGLEYQRRKEELTTDINNLKRLYELLKKQRDEEKADDSEYLENLRNEKVHENPNLVGTTR